MNQSAPKWEKPKSFPWDYTRFGKSGSAAADADETIEITIVLWACPMTRETLKATSPLARAKLTNVQRSEYRSRYRTFARVNSGIHTRLRTFASLSGVPASLGKTLLPTPAILECPAAGGRWQPECRVDTTTARTFTYDNYGNATNVVTTVADNDSTSPDSGSHDRNVHLAGHEHELVSDSANP